MRFSVLDFETANDDRDSISEIGVVVLEDRKIVDTYKTLVKPEPFYFHPFNIELTGITPQMCENARTFEELYPEFKKYLTGNVVSHYAPFDKSCLLACLNKYSLDYPEFNYFCSWRVARYLLAELPTHRLSYLADLFNVKYEAHKALEDATATATILLDIMEKNKLSSFDDIMNFGFTIFRDNKAIPVKPLLKFPRKTNFLPKPPKVEYKRETPFLRDIEIGFDSISDIIDVVDEITVERKNFVISGLFSTITRKDLKKTIEERGGVVKDDISTSVDYLIIGDKPTPSWKTSKYGSKIETALKWRKIGKSLPLILPEANILELINNAKPPSETHEEDDIQDTTEKIMQEFLDTIIECYSYPKKSTTQEPLQNGNTDYR